MFGTHYWGALRRRLNVAAVCVAMLVSATTTCFADPVSPAGWTSNIQMAVPLPEGVYFINTAVYIKRSGSSLAPGLDEIDAIVNIPTAVWSTPWQFLGGQLELIGFPAQVGVGINPGASDGSSSWHRDFYNPSGLIGVTWDLGGGWSVGEFVGGFTPVDTDIGNNVGLGGNFWTFGNVFAVAYNSNGWSLSANFIYLNSGDNVDTGVNLQPDTIDVDFAMVKHINKWEFGLVGSASADVSHALRNNWGKDEFSQFSLGGLVGYSFGSVTAEIFATRSLVAENQVGGGKDTRLWTRLIVPLWNP
jgi:hypothetical protein